MAGFGNGSASEKTYNSPAGSGIHQDVTSESTGRAPYQIGLARSASSASSWPNGVRSGNGSRSSAASTSTRNSDAVCSRSNQRGSVQAGTRGRAPGSLTGAATCSGDLPRTSDRARVSIRPAWENGLDWHGRECGPWWHGAGREHEAARMAALPGSPWLGDDARQEADGVAAHAVSHLVAGPGEHLEVGAGPE